MSLLRRLGLFVGLLSPVLLAGCGADGQTVHVVPGAAELPNGLVDTFIAPIPLPTAVAPLPDGRLLVTAKDGGVFLIGADGVAQSGAVLTFGDVCKNSERGVLGVVADPAFATNSYVYIYATRDYGSGCKNRVSRYTLSGSTISPASESDKKRAERAPAIARDLASVSLTPKVYAARRSKARGER